MVLSFRCRCDLTKKKLKLFNALQINLFIRILHTNRLDIDNNQPLVLNWHCRYLSSSP